MVCGYPYPMHIQCVSHSIFDSGQHFTLSFSSYSSHAAVVPTSLLIGHPPAPALGTFTRWRWSILFWYTGWRWSIFYWYTGWRWSILYWYTGWRWSILYSGDVGVEHLACRVAVEHSLLVYRNAVERSLLRRRRSGTSLPGDSGSWYVAILSLCIFNAFRIPF